MDNTIASAAGLLSRALTPFVKALDGSEDLLLAYFGSLGWELPLIPPAVFDLQSSSTQLAASLAQLDDKLRRMPDGAASESDVNQAAAALLVDFADFASALRALPAGLRNQLPAAFVAATHIDEQVQERLFNDALSRLIEGESPEIDMIARVLGLLESVPRDADPALFQPAFTERVIRWDRLQTLARGPAALAGEVYGWGTASLDTTKLLLALRDLSFVFLAPVYFDYATRPLQHAVVPGLPAFARRERGVMVPLNTGTALELALGLYPIPQLQPSELQGLMIALSGMAGITESFDITPQLKLTVQSQIDLAAGVALAVWPDRPAKIVGNTLSGGSPIEAGQARIGLRYAPGSTGTQDERIPLLSFPAVLLDGAALSVELGVGATVESGTNVFIEAGLPGLRLQLGNLQGDSFLAKILPVSATLDFDVYVGWSLDEGLYWKGSAGSEINIPVSKTIGPVTIDRIDVVFSSTNDAYRLTIGVSATARLGPAVLRIERLGVAAVLDTGGGNLGLVDVGLGAVPPRGIGVAIDTGLVTGGGFLDFDPEAGRYFGALELDVRGVGIKAFGLLETEFPNGVPAYSFIIVVSVEFTPVQLGFGFTLNGVGGLLGVHRRIDVEALRTRMRTGALDHLLFPHNLIENSGAILSDLQAVYPMAENRYVFGPMAIIGWPTPTLLTGKLGIILEVPEPMRLVLLGLFQVAIPRPEEAIVELNLDVIGDFDLQRGCFALDGRLRNSRVVWFPLEGEIAARAGDRNLLISVGGWHPAFQPPPGFPKLQRVTVPIGADEDPRLTLEGYFAVTSNTLQLGARVTVYASAGWFNVYGEVGFNALISRSPLSFDADLSGKVALRKAESVIAGITLSAKLSGPLPFHAAGEACLEIRWLPDICVGFDKTFGENRRVELPFVDPWPLLRDAVQNPESWNGEQIANAFRAATLAGPPGLLDPALGVTLRQSVVPLNRTLTRFGAGQPAGGTVRFDVGTVTGGIGQSVGPFTPVDDFFAPAQFEDLSNDEKLSRPSFEPMAAGITMAREAIGIGTPVSTPIRYETVVIDSIFDRRPAGPHFPTRHWQLAVGGFGAAAQAPLRNSGPSKFTGPTKRVLAHLEAEQFVVVSTVDLSLRSYVSSASVKGAAFQALSAYLMSHPEERGRLEVVSLDELGAAT